MIEIDCLGDMCPVPILKLKDAIKTASANQTIKLITDHSCVLENIKDIKTELELENNRGAVSKIFCCFIFKKSS